MATPKLKLVATESEQPQAGGAAKWRDELSAPWKQEAVGWSRLASTLVTILLGTVLIAAFLYLYNRIQQNINGKTSPPPTSSSRQEFMVTKSADIHSAPGASKNRKLGVCEAGTRIRVIGTQTVGHRVFYEIKILSKRPKQLDSPGRKWIAAEYAMMERQ